MSVGFPPRKSALNGKIYGMTKTGGSIPTPGSSKKKPTYDNGVIFSIPLASLS
jgi:hypothetical protein